MTFVVLVLLASLFSQTGHAQAVSPTHPRVWATPARLQRLRDYAARNTLRWQKVKASADAAINNPAATDPEQLPPLGVAYQITQNPAYAQRAIQVMLANAIPTNILSGDSYYYYRLVIPDMSFGFDWCYDQMTSAQRTQVASWLMDRADAIWPDTTPSRAYGWAVNDPGNNYFYGFLTTWSAALAVYGDDARAPYHLNLALTKYRTLVRPFTDTWGTGGVFAESTNYDSTWQFSQILDAHRTATGQDLFNEPGFNFMHDSLYWRIYSTVPTMDYYYNLGTQSRIPSGPTFDYDRWRALIPRANINDPVIAGYSKQWLDNLNPNICNQPYTVAWEFLFYDEEAPSIDYTAALPLYYFASGPGILIHRSDWTPQATYWGIWSGPLQQSHQFFDVNGFLIYKGHSWLVGNDSMWSHDGTLQDTAYHNNLTFGGTGQDWQYPDALWPDPAGKVLKQENTTDYTYFAGSSAQAYVQGRWHGGTVLATDCVRKFVNIAPDTFFVYDRATLINPALAKEWHLHSQNPITVNGRTYKFDNGTHQLVGQSLLPATGVTVQSVPQYLGFDAVTPSSYRLDVVTSNNQATDSMLNVLQVAPVGATGIPVAQPIVVDTGNMEGAVCGGWAVLFGKIDVVAQSVSYSLSSAASLQNLVLDLQPSTDYKIQLTNLASQTSTVWTQGTTDQGSLRFSVPAGGYHVTLTIPSVFATATASFVRTDTVTRGDWKGVYGKEGYNVIQDSVSYPAYAAVTANSNIPFTWEPLSNDGRALLKASAGGRIAACWRAGLGFTVDVNLTDANVHRVTLYGVDWDSANARAERIDILDAATNILLNSQSLSSFTTGKYLSWNISGHVLIRITTTTGYNPVLSGIFFDAPAIVTGDASFVQTDAITQGSWKGVYGADGCNVIQDAASYPAYASITPSGQTGYTWVPSTADVHALQKAASATDRIAACWTAPANMSLDINLTDGQYHQVALYCLDWDSVDVRALRFNIYDVGTGIPLDIESVSSFTSGKYMVWKIKGHVRMDVTSTGGRNLVLSGLFFDPPGTGGSVPTLSSVTLSPTSVVGGSTSTGTVTLSGPATADAVISLVGAGGSATVPASVTVSAGQNTANFTVSTSVVANSTTTQVTASYNGISQTANLTINPVVRLTALSLSPTTVTAGNVSTGTVTLSAASNSATVVNLSSASASATIPASVTVPAGQTSATFSVNTSAVNASTAAQLTASYNGVNQAATLTINPVVRLTSLAVAPSSVVAGTGATGTVTLNAASATSTIVSLSSGSASATIPASVTVPAGQTSATFSVNTSAVNASTAAQLTASYNGVNQAATLTINPVVRITSLTVSPTSVLGGSGATGTVSVNVAPVVDMVVALTSASTNATVPATVIVPVGQTSATFSVNTSAVSANTTALLTASYNGVNQTASLAITPPGKSTPVGVIGDFNGDGKMDLVWQNDTTGDISAWYMNGTKWNGLYDMLGAGVPTEWKVAGVADLNGDGKSDLVWMNQKTGDVAYWLMNGPVRVASDYIERGIPTEWKIVSVVDLNGDGSPDFVWMNQKTGDVAYWLMNGTIRVTSDYIARTIQAEWKVVGTGDFNKDGKPDLVWQNTQTGDVVAWYMNGVQWTGNFDYIARGIPTVWQIFSVGDYNGDGSPDLIWQNRTTGDVSYWSMSGLQRSDSGLIAPGIPLPWRITGRR